MKLMKTKFIVALMALTVSVFASTNITFWVKGTNGITAVHDGLYIPTNSTVKLLSAISENTTPEIRFQTSNSGFGFMDVILNSNQIFGTHPPMLCGPGYIQFAQSSGSEGSFTFEMSNTDEPSVTPSGSVVIPADTVGNCEIILEQSQDLVTWTAALPGIYGSSTANRFFRVRAVHL